MEHCEMAPSCPLPIAEEFSDADEYVTSLLDFSTSSELFETLCGGVQVLDFFTGHPEPYTAVFPPSWRGWFSTQNIHDILNLLLRDDLAAFEKQGTSRLHVNPAQLGADSLQEPGSARQPPQSLVDYIRDVRKHSLVRNHTSLPQELMVREVAVGMKPKKIHEVVNFARYVDQLADDVSANGSEITHLVDFGSGQNYLGRALASKPYDRRVVAVESLQSNIEGALDMDVTAKLAIKQKVRVNKKVYRQQLTQLGSSRAIAECETGRAPLVMSLGTLAAATPTATPPVGSQMSNQPHGEIQYVQHRITDGELSDVIRQISRRDIAQSAVQHTTNIGRQAQDDRLMVISLHSCGNLVHHGLRALVMNPSVVAVALVGCCYNRMTERLPPEMSEIRQLRSNNARVLRESNACDPHGFPISQRFDGHRTRHGQGIRLNVTARMMAVQAPHNWSRLESEAFFTRHFFRALFQRILLDRGLVPCPTDRLNASEPAAPIIIGSLRKACYASFTTYVRAAIAKLTSPAEDGSHIHGQLDRLTDEEIAAYETRYRHRKLELSVAWSFMAFSAMVTESLILVDRWCFLREQDVVKTCWVEAVFDAAQSPRNLVVVGIKS